MIISSQFDGGNIECTEQSDASNIQLRIKADNQSEFYQWFYFKASNVKDTDCRYVIKSISLLMDIFNQIVEFYKLIYCNNLRQSICHIIC